MHPRFQWSPGPRRLAWLPWGECRPPRGTSLLPAFGKPAAPPSGDRSRYCTAVSHSTLPRVLPLHPSAKVDHDPSLGFYSAGLPLASPSPLLHSFSFSIGFRLESWQTSLPGALWRLPLCSRALECRGPPAQVLRSVFPGHSYVPWKQLPASWMASLACSGTP